MDFSHAFFQSDPEIAGKNAAVGRGGGGRGE